MEEIDTVPIVSLYEGKFKYFQWKNSVKAPIIYASIVENLTEDVLHDSEMVGGMVGRNQLINNKIQ